MKLAIIGSRSYNDYNLAKVEFSKFDNVDMIVSGGAIGADTIAEKLANEFDIPITIFKPDWKTYGKAAGMIRNKNIVDFCDCVLAFWDGQSKGTKNSLDYAKKKLKGVKVIKC